MLADPWFYAVAIPAVIIIGFGKGFGGGVAILGIPLMALVVPPLDAAAIMLPILVAMDAVAVWSWWGVFDRRSLIILMPAALVGVVIGWVIAAYVTDEAVKLIVGAIGLAFTLNYVFSGRFILEPKKHNPAKGWFWGAVAGFTSFISHAGGPPAQMYLLPLRLDPKVLAGTSVLLFAAVNFAKLLPYAMLGQFSSAHLAAAAVLLPLAPLATWFGARMVKVISAKTFYGLSYVFLFVVATKLFYDGLVGLF